MLARWSVFLFVLATVMLVGSVLLPADESERVLGLLNDEERLIEPMRLLGTQIVSGIAEENAELQRYGSSGDSVAFSRYRKAADRDDKNVRGLRRVAIELGPDVAVDANAIGRLVERWRALTPNRVDGHALPSNFRETATAREAVRDSIVVATVDLGSRLADWSARKRVAVTAHEKRGIVINATLVLIALAALAAVFEVMRRERRRSQREAALRITAEMLARAYSVADVDRQVVFGATELFEAHRAVVEHAEPKGGESIVARVIRDGRPVIAGVPFVSNDPALRGRAMVIPLGTPDLPVGAVTAFEAKGHRFHRDDLAWAEIFGHLASFSYEKVRLLEEAEAGRARLQRTMDSRGRLIRGFSHDVKNPLGAADGYAALLEDGVYGAVTDEQRGSVARVRSALHRALSLIDDLHELARAETGHLDIHLESIDLGALVELCGDEYRATAEAKHLTFTIERDANLPRVDTDPSRIRQIVGNLLSNAIKYTTTGSIALRARSETRADLSVPHVFVEVQDTGPGIPIEKHALIFEEFARLAPGKHSGAGLGLAISKHVADALGCRLELRSEVGAGSLFTLCVPVRAEIGPDAMHNAQPGSRERASDDRGPTEINEVRSV